MYLYKKKNSLIFLNNYFIKNGQYLKSDKKLLSEAFYYFKCSIFLDKILQKELGTNNFNNLFKIAVDNISPKIGLYHFKYDGNSERLLTKKYPFFLSERQRFRFLKNLIKIEFKEYNFKMSSLGKFLGKELYLSLKKKGILYKRKKLYDRFILLNNLVTNR